MENIKQAKGNECSRYKSTAAIFSFSLPSCPLSFYLVMPRHVLSPCYARYVHTRGIKDNVTYYLACHVRLQVQDMPYYMRLRVQNMPECHLRKYGWGTWADWRKKSQQYFCTDCIHFLLACLIFSRKGHSMKHHYQNLDVTRWRACHFPVNRWRCSKCKVLSSVS